MRSILTPFLLLFVFFKASFSEGLEEFAESESPENSGTRRKLQGDDLDFTRFNFILDQVGVEIPSDTIPDSDFSQGFTGGSVDFKINIGGVDREAGSCDSFSIDDGGFRIIGEELAPRNGLQRERFTIIGEGLKLKCIIDLRIKIDRLTIGFISVPLGGIQDDQQGTMEIDLVDGLSWSQSFIVSSPDFTTTPPSATLAGDCELELGDIRVDARDAIALFDNVIPGGINLDGQVERQLNRDASLLTEPIGENVCDLSRELALSLGELLSQNPFTNIGAGSILTGGGFFDADENGIIDAIETEAELVRDVADQTLNLIRGNFLVDAIFPQDSANEENLLEQFFDSFELGDQVVNQSDAVGLIVALLNDSFNLTLDRPVENLELVPLIDVINSQADTPNPDLIDGVGDDRVLVIVDDVFDLDFVTIDVRFIARNFLVSENGGTNDEGSIFSGMSIFSNFSVLLPNFDFGDFLFTADLDLDISIDFDADAAEASDFIDSFQVTFPRETITFEATLEGFLAKAVGLIPIDETKLEDLQIGPIIADALGCITSSFTLPAVLTAFGGDVDRIRGSVGGFNDAIVNVAGDVINALVFSYQSVILRGLETVLADQLLDPPIEILEVGNCTELFENETNTVDEFDFANSIFTDLIELADAEFFEEVIGFIISGDGEAELVLVDEEDPAEIVINLFSAGGFIQDIDLLIKGVRVLGISPPVVNSAGLGLNDESEFAPQAITADIDFVTDDQRLILELDIDIIVNEPKVDPEADPEDVLSEPPLVYNGTESNNFVSISLEINNIKAFIEIIASLSVFDVDGTRLGDVAVTDCWVKNLDFPGGFSVINVETTLGQMVMNCDCESAILNLLAETISSVEGFGELNFDIQQVVDAVASSFITKFNEDNFDFTQESAESVCSGDNALERAFSIDPDSKKSPAAFVFIGLLAAVLMFMLPIILVGSVEKKVKASRQKNILEPAPSPIKKVLSEEDQDALLLRLKEFDEENGNKSEKVALFRNEHIPKQVRIGVALLLVINLALFVYGDFGVAIEIILQGNFLEGPLPPQDFGSFSVVTATIDLYKNGAVGLAILIFVVVLFWPYFKLISLTVCYFASPIVLPIRRRGNFIHFLDTFGKWSIVEVFFVIFLRLDFELNVSSPRTLYLPDVDIYSIELLILPQISFYTFATAVVLSILVSNILMVYHEKIVRRNADDIRNQVYILGTNQSVLIKMPMHNYLFYTKKREIDGTPNYAFSLTYAGKVALTVFTIICGVLTLLANALFVVKVRYLGIFRLFLEFADIETEPSFSVFSMVGDVLSKGAKDGDAGAIYLAFIVIWVQFFAPLIVLASSLLILYKGLTLRDARRYKVLRACFAAWSCLEVFILSIAIAVIEIPEVAKALTADSCDFFFDFMANTLLPLGLVREEDVENTCFGLDVSILVGGYLYLIAIFANLLNAIIILRLFDHMIKQRKSVEKIDTTAEPETRELDTIERLDRNQAGGGEKVNFSRTVWICSKLRLINAYRKDDPVTT